MRLYPPGVFLIREPLTEDFHLMDITIPKGTWVHVRLTLSLHCTLKATATLFMLPFCWHLNPHQRNLQV